ncbi:hypothetical protein [Winogradskyella sp. SYSU M77433]|uniref:acyltransferase n=1 Tax=Winogradskyella sp. SYSU M77433 TaxID=3042722 RepID=UPI0024810380|nr:hypothetical protein [Winogradskyella sp. SYSU M77433]MDH7911525.1 hypothetical protein [Winogradskyella sp. SYSU M77433]
MNKVFEKLFVKRLLGSKLFNEFLERRIYEFIVKKPKIIGPKERLIISDNAYPNNYFANTNSGKIFIGDYVFFGKNVSLITGTHNYRVFGKDRVEDYPKEGRDIIIDHGAWIASNSIVLGPCKIGKNSVVAAGSVVVDDVEPFTIVAGNPAKILRHIKSDDR